MCMPYTTHGKTNAPLIARLLMSANNLQLASFPLASGESKRDWVTLASGVIITLQSVSGGVSDVLRCYGWKQGVNEIFTAQCNHCARHSNILVSTVDFCLRHPSLLTFSPQLDFPGAARHTAGFGPHRNIPSRILHSCSGALDTKTSGYSHHRGPSPVAGCAARRCCGS